MKRTLRIDGFNDAQELATHLLELCKLHNDAPLYVHDEHGEEFTRVETVETTLTDGSKVVDVYLRLKSWTRELEPNAKLRSHAIDCPQRVGSECTCGAFEHNERIYAI